MVTRTFPHLWVAVWNRERACKTAALTRLSRPVYARRSPFRRENFQPSGELIGVTADTLWADVAERLRSTLNTTTYRTWFGGAGGTELTDEAFVIGVPNDFTREWIEGHFLGFISAAVRDVTGRDRRVV